MAAPADAASDRGAPGMSPAGIVLLVAGALAAGVGSAWWAVSGTMPPFGVVRIGPWAAAPQLGSTAIDPYARAIVVRGVHLPLGAGQGLALVAERDSGGAALRGSCSYRIHGNWPGARAWTLTLEPLGPEAGPAAGEALTHAAVTAFEGRPLEIVAAPAIVPGNWLRITTPGPFRLTLRLYDTPLAAHAAQLTAEALPAIEQAACP